MRSRPTLQFEFDRSALDRYPAANLFVEAAYGAKRASAARTARQVILSAMWDTLDHCGTFVLVVSPETVTVVQRPDAADLEEETPLS
jgi:hypothetical protein